MNLYLIRHSEAVDISDTGSLTDFDRPLADSGKQFSITLARALIAHGIRADLLFHSPLVRAVQTAEPLIEAWKLGVDQVVVCEELSPGKSNRRLAAKLNRHPGQEIVLVGHRPDINDFAGWLIGSKKAQIGFEKGSIALVRVEDDSIEKGCGELIWLIPPSWIA